MSDYVANVLKLYLRMEDAGVTLSPVQQKELLDLHDVISTYYDTVHKGFAQDTFELYLSDIHRDSREVTAKIRALRDRHWHRLSDETVEPLVSTSYMDIANAYRRMKDHLLNIGEAIVGGKDIARQVIESEEEMAG